MVTENIKTKDKDLALVIGNIMRWGVIVSLSLTFLGGIIYLVQNGSEVVSYNSFVEQDRSIGEILNSTFQGLLHFDGLSMITLGILLLFSTPVIRVVFSLIGFIIERDKLYIVITLIVLAIIVVSVMGGLG